MHDAVHMRGHQVDTGRQDILLLAGEVAASIRSLSRGSGELRGRHPRRRTLQRGASLRQVSRLNPTNCFFRSAQGSVIGTNVLEFRTVFLVRTHWELWIAGYGPSLSE